MQARGRAAAALAASVCLVAAACIPVLVFHRPASTLCDVGALARLGSRLAWRAGAPAGPGELDSLAGWAGFELDAGAIPAERISASACALFPYRMAALGFASDSSVAVLVSSLTDIDLRPAAPGGPVLLRIGDRAAVIAVPGEASAAMRAASGVSLP